MKFGLPFFGLEPEALRLRGPGRRGQRLRIGVDARAPGDPGGDAATYPYTESGFAPITPETPLYDPWVVLGSVASATETHPPGHQRVHPSVATPDRHGPIGGHPRPTLRRTGHPGRRCGLARGRVRHRRAVLRRSGSADGRDHGPAPRACGPGRPSSTTASSMTSARRPSRPRHCKSRTSPSRSAAPRPPPSAGPAGSVTAGSRSAPTISTSWRPRWPSSAAPPPIRTPGPRL